MTKEEINYFMYEGSRCKIIISKYFMEKYSAFFSTSILN